MYVYNTVIIVVLIILHNIIMNIFLVLESNPILTEEVCIHINDLDNQIVLLRELRAGYESSVFELQALKHQYQTLNSAKVCYVWDFEV